MSNPAAAYVRMAIAAINVADSHDVLLTWWDDERANRAKWHLSPNQWPGQDLKEAFNKRRNELKSKDQEDGGYQRSIPEQVSQIG